MNGMNGWLDNPWVWFGFIGFLLLFGALFGGSSREKGVNYAGVVHNEAPKFTFIKAVVIISAMVVASLWFLGIAAWNGNYLALVILLFLIVGGFVVTVVLVFGAMFIGFEAIDEYFDNKQAKILVGEDKELDREYKRLRNQKIKRDSEKKEGNVVEMGGDDGDGMVIDQGFS